jgi:hypothetical protein
MATKLTTLRLQEFSGMTYVKLFYNFASCDLKPESGIIDPEKTLIARQRLGEHVSAETTALTTTDKMLEVVFSMLSVPKLYMHCTSVVSIQSSASEDSNSKRNLHR